MDALGWQIKPHHIEDWKQPITVVLEGVFKDKRSCPDLHNLLKVICDEIEEVTGLNDRDYLTKTGEPLIRRDEEPTLIITIKEGE
jgi:Holliday junction resolvase RusA-like endonuclease